MKLVRLLAAAMAILSLGSCYIPMRFDAEINIARDGQFTLEYDGILAHASLIPGLQKEPMDAEQTAEAAQGVLADLQRDSGFGEIEFLGQGQFRVSYFKAGNIFEMASVTFVRTDSNILSLTYISDTGQITVRGTAVPEAQKAWILEAGLNSIGEIRVITDARVLEHNATAVVPAEKGQQYVWVVRDIDAPPLLLIIG